MARRTSLSQFLWLVSLSFRSIAAGAIIVSFTGCQDPAAPPASLAPTRAPALAAKAGGADDAIPDEYIVTFDDSVTDAPGLAKQLGAEHGATVRHTYSAALKGFSAHMSAQAAAALEHNPHVARVEADRIASVDAVQSGATWGLDRIDQTALPLDSSYSATGDGTGVNVYIIDTGIRTSHVEFGGRAVGAYTSISDGRGTADCNGHGTHVAGTVGSARYGVAKNVKLYAVRVLDCAGSGTISGIVAGVDWVTKNRVRPAVANMSLGTSTSSTLDQAVQNSINAGVVYTVSAGNNATDACTQSPARVAGALTVAATQWDDTQLVYSNYGSCVDLYAPGRLVQSLGYATDTSTALMSGTSMSAPHVAGAAALVLQANPSATPAAVAQAITSSATPNAVIGASAGTANKLLYTGGLAAPVSMPTPTPIPTPTPAPTPAPAPALVVTFTVGCPKSLCTFDASATSGGSAPYAYTWAFGDATTNAGSSSAKVSHQYASKGTYVVKVSVTDAAGKAATSQATVSIKKM